MIGEGGIRVRLEPEMVMTLSFDRSSATKDRSNAAAGQDHPTEPNRTAVPVVAVGPRQRGDEGAYMASPGFGEADRTVVDGARCTACVEVPGVTGAGITIIAPD